MGRIANKTESSLLQTGRYSMVNQLTLNADRAEPLFFSNMDDLKPKVTINANTIKCAESWRHLCIKLTLNCHLW